MVFTLIIALVAAVIAVVFALQNPMTVTVSLFGYPVDGSLALFILLSVGLGVLIGVLIMTPGRIKSSISGARQRKQIGSLETSLSEHKTKLEKLEQEKTDSQPAQKS